MLTALMMLVITSVFTSESTSADVAPGINRIDRFVDDSLSVLLEGANAPIFSPDGQHLYIGRLGDPELAFLVVLGLDDAGRTFLVSSISNLDEGFEAVSRIAMIRYCQMILLTTFCFRPTRRS